MLSGPKDEISDSDLNALLALIHGIAQDQLEQMELEEKIFNALLTDQTDEANLAYLFQKLSLPGWAIVIAKVREETEEGRKYRSFIKDLAKLQLTEPAYDRKEFFEIVANASRSIVTGSSADKIEIIKKLYMIFYKLNMIAQDIRKSFLLALIKVRDEHRPAQLSEKEYFEDISDEYAMTDKLHFPTNAWFYWTTRRMLRNFKSLTGIDLPPNLKENTSDLELFKSVLEVVKRTGKTALPYINKPPAQSKYSSQMRQFKHKVFVSELASYNTRAHQYYTETLRYKIQYKAASIRNPGTITADLLLAVKIISDKIEKILEELKTLTEPRKSGDDFLDDTAYSSLALFEFRLDTLALYLEELKAGRLHPQLRQVITPTVLTKTVTPKAATTKPKDKPAIATTTEEGPLAEAGPLPKPTKPKAATAVLTEAEIAANRAAVELEAAQTRKRVEETQRIALEHKLREAEERRAKELRDKELEAQIAAANRERSEVKKPPAATAPAAAEPETTTLTLEQACKPSDHTPMDVIGRLNKLKQAGLLDALQDLYTTVNRNLVYRPADLMQFVRALGGNKIGIEGGHAAFQIDITEPGDTHSRTVVIGFNEHTTQAPGKLLGCYVNKFISRFQEPTTAERPGLGITPELLERFLHGEFDTPTPGGTLRSRSN